VTGSLEDLQAAVDALDGTHDSVELALALTELGCAAADPAVLRQAHDVARAAGATGLAADALAELEALGAEAPDHPEDRRIDTLDSRELQTARLAAAGLTDREIAEAQLTTVRTIEQHLAAVYATLGVEGRGQLSDALGL
jgi:DNA-binding NarL/FixJ family response regulator